MAICHPPSGFLCSMASGPGPRNLLETTPNPPCGTEETHTVKGESLWAASVSGLFHSNQTCNVACWHKAVNIRFVRKGRHRDKFTRNPVSARWRSAQQATCLLGAEIGQTRAKRRTLDFVKVPQREKAEVLAAFAAHKNEVTAGYVAKPALQCNPVNSIS